MSSTIIQAEAPRPSAEALADERRPPGRAHRGWLVLGAAVVLSGLLALGIGPRLQRPAPLAETAQAANTYVPIVRVVSPRLAPASTDVVLPGSIQAIKETPIYTRANGYLRRRLVDIGDRIRAGQLLAEIESPDLDQQVMQACATLQQARANLVQARANRDFARVTADRWDQLEARELVAHQDADQQRSAFSVSQANVQAAQTTVSAQEATVRQLEALQPYEKVTAPFAGIITARTADVGALITAGSSTSTLELFRMGRIDTLRIYINVPQPFVPAVQPGQTAQVLVQEFPQQSFTGTVVRTANALDPTSRTLLTEVQMSNQDAKPLPGMYAQVKFVASRATPPWVIPANTLVIRTDGSQVATVGADHRVHYQKVDIGRDYGREVEIVSGLNGAESLTSNPTDELAEGTPVQVVAAQP
jgi:RND family efflux transporter MFP subunit